MMTFLKHLAIALPLGVIGVPVLIMSLFSTNRGETKYVVDKENCSLSVSYDHLLGMRYVTFSFDIEHEVYDCSRGSGMPSFELFEVIKMDWSRIPSLFKE